MIPGAVIVPSFAFDGRTDGLILRGESRRFGAAAQPAERHRSPLGPGAPRCPFLLHRLHRKDPPAVIKEPGQARIRNRCAAFPPFLADGTQSPQTAPPGFLHLNGSTTNEACPSPV